MSTDSTTPSGDPVPIFGEMSDELDALRRLDSVVERHKLVVDALRTLVIADQDAVVVDCFTRLDQAHHDLAVRAAALRAKLEGQPGA